MKNEKSYTTDAGRLTCSCGDFRFKRRRFAVNDPRRLCKHLCAANIDFSDKFDPRKLLEIQAVLPENGFPIDLRFEAIFDKKQISLHLPDKNYQPVVNIFDDTGKFFFDVAAKKWKDSVCPAAKNEIEKWAIKTWIQKYGKKALNNIYGPVDDNWDREEALKLAEKYGFKMK